MKRPRPKRFCARPLLAGSAATEVLETYAEFLDRHGSAETPGGLRETPGHCRGQPDENTQRAIARRLVLLSLETGDRAAAAGYLRQYREAGGKDWEQATLERAPAPAAPRETIEIPGPLNFLQANGRGFAGRNGGGAAGGAGAQRRNQRLPRRPRKEGLEPTEYLKLLTRYLSQARELEKLAGPEKTLRVESCDSAQAGDLLRVLGYRMRGGCGSEVVLETVNATRAFLTIDSGFPPARAWSRRSGPTAPSSTITGRPRSPSWRARSYWLGATEKQAGEFIDAFIADPSLCRFYLAMSKPDSDTAEELRKAIPAQRLRAFAHVLDFYGSMFEIRSGKAMVPGGARTRAHVGGTGGRVARQGRGNSSSA